MGRAEQEAAKQEVLSRFSLRSSLPLPPLHHSRAAPFFLSAAAVRSKSPVFDAI